MKHLWQKANPLITIISDRGSDKIVDDWKKAYNLSLGTGTSKQVSYHVILDKLFDIARCKCSIISSKESNYDGCNQNFIFHANVQRKLKFL